MDETYIKVKGDRVYLNRAIVKHGMFLILCCQKLLMRPQSRPLFENAFGSRILPEKVVMDK